MRRYIPDPEPRYQIAVKATDEAVQSDRKSTDAYITIIATGHGNGPVFETDGLTGSVYENEPPGTSVITVSARQKDNSLAEIEYYVTNVTGLGGKQAGRLFDVDTKLGVVSTAEVLDREAAAEWYEVEIYAIVVNTHTPQTGKTKVRRLYFIFKHKRRISVDIKECRKCLTDVLAYLQILF